MNAQLSHLPLVKQEELMALTQVLETIRGIEMVILFGSYARGTWVEDIYVEKGITYEYKSDFDILVVTKENNAHKNYQIECKVNKNIPSNIRTPLGLIYHSIKYLNNALTEGSYFFNDIKKEGIILYNSGKFELEEPKELTPEEAKQKAKDYYDFWFNSANEFLDTFQYDLGKGRLPKAAFELHQAAERYYTTILLVFTDYRPKEHDLERLDQRAVKCNKRFDVFPRTTKEEQDLFQLLRRAYVDARYKMNEYYITISELEYLAERVKELQRLTEEICVRKIGG